MRIDEIEITEEVTQEKVSKVAENTFVFTNLPLPGAKYDNLLDFEQDEIKYMQRPQLRKKYKNDPNWIKVTIVWDPKISAPPSSQKMLKNFIESYSEITNQPGAITLSNMKYKENWWQDQLWPGKLHTVSVLDKDGKTYVTRNVHFNKYYIRLSGVDVDPADNTETEAYFRTTNPAKWKQWREYEEWVIQKYGDNAQYQYIMGVYWPLFKKYRYTKLDDKSKQYYDYLETMINGMRKIGDPTRKAPGEAYDATELRVFWEPITDYIKKDNDKNKKYHGADFARFYFDEEYKQAKQADLFAEDTETSLSLKAVVKEEQEEYLGFTIKTTTKGEDKRIEVFSPPKMPETEQTFDTVEDAKKWIDGVIQEVEQQAKDKAEQERLEKEKQERIEAMKKFPSDTVDDNLWYWKLEDNKLYYSSETYEGQWQTWSYLTPNAVKGYLNGEDVLLYDEDESTGTAFEASLFEKSVYPNLVEYLKKELDLKPKEQEPEPEPEQKKPEEVPPQDDKETDTDTDKDKETDTDTDKDKVNQQDKTQNDVDDIIKDKESEEPTFVSTFPKLKGSLHKPSVGRLTDTDLPNTLSYNAMPGSWVQAAEKGTVGFVGNLRDYGDMIILNHDQDYATVYTNVGELKVDKGDTVNKGDVLALVGKRPMGFQVRLKGKAIEDPSDWLEN